MAFIKYTESARSFAAKASISKAGMLSFTDGARKRFHMDEFKFCVLYYDPEARRVGVELTNDENTEGARRLRHRDTGSDVAAKSFTQYFEIDVEVTTTYPATKDQETGMVVIDLSEGKARGESNKG